MGRSLNLVNSNHYGPHFIAHGTTKIFSEIQFEKKITGNNIWDSGKI